MSWPKVKLGDVAPAIPVKNVNLDEDELVWQLNLDQIESNTGKSLIKLNNLYQVQARLLIFSIMNMFCIQSYVLI
ncbi:hypothetical protein [Escherichia coli]